MVSKNINYDKIIAELEQIKYANEYRTKTVKGVKNLSFSDIDTILLYVNDHRKYNGEQLHGRLMEPRGHIKEVLDRYNIKYPKPDFPYHL